MPSITSKIDPITRGSTTQIYSTTPKEMYLAVDTIETIHNS